MKLIITLSFTMIWPAVVAAQQQARTDAVTDNGRYRTTVWEFGVVPPRTELRHTFTIKNDTEIPWTVKYVSKSCACTVGEFSSKSVKPLETLSVEVTFRVEKEGTVHQSIVVDLKERKAPVLCFVMKGESRRPLSADPAVVDFGPVSSIDRVTRTVELRNYSDQDVSITRVEAPAWLKVEHRTIPSTSDNKRPRQAWNLVVALDASRLKKGEPEAASLLVHTSSDKVGPAVIPVNLQVKALLSTVPGELKFKTVGAGSTTQKMIFLDVSPEVGKLTEKDIHVSHNLGDDLEVQVFKTGTENRFMVVGKFRPKQTRGPVEGTLEIKTARATAGVVQAKVSAVVK